MFWGISAPAGRPRDANVKIRDQKPVDAEVRG